MQASEGGSSGPATARPMPVADRTAVSATARAAKERIRGDSARRAPIPAGPDKSVRSDQLPHHRRDLLAVELDAPQQLLVGQRPDRVLQVEPVEAQATRRPWRSSSPPSPGRRRTVRRPDRPSDRTEPAAWGATHARARCGRASPGSGATPPREPPRPSPPRSPARGRRRVGRRVRPTPASGGRARRAARKTSGRRR